MLRWSAMRAEDIANGPGIRTSIWVQGCPFHCKNCFNEETWDPNGGHILTNDIIDLFIKQGSKSYIKGFSILGGEPLFINSEDMLKFVLLLKNDCPDKTIWMWTGYKYEDLRDNQLEIVRLVDVLVDGPFDYSLKNPNLRFRGSSNQRIINIPETIKTKEVILLKEYMEA